MTNKEFKQKLIELNVLDLYLESVKTCSSGRDYTTLREENDPFPLRIQASFIWEYAKAPTGTDSYDFWNDISKSK